MAFDLGITEGFDRLFGTSVSRRNQPSQTFPVGAGLSSTQSQRAGQVAGITTLNQTPAYSSSGSPNFSSYSSPIGPKPVSSPVQVQRNRSTSAPAPSFQGATPQLGATRQTTSTNTRRPEDVDQSLAEQQQINELYGGTANFLNSLQSAIEGDLGGALDAAGSQFDAQRPFLDQARNELIGQNTAQQQAEQVQARNALDEAKLLYSELGQANRQRYGGTSSAGDFASALQGREFQRGQNRIQTTSQQNLQALRERATSINQNYQNQVQQLEAQKTAALNDIRNQFQERLRQIDAQKADNEAQKAAAKLDALREVRARAQAIEDQKAQFQQQLEAQTLGAAQNIFSAIQSYRAEQGQPVDLASLPGANFSTIGGALGTQEQALPQGFFRRPDTSQEFLPQGLFRPELAA